MVSRSIFCGWAVLVLWGTGAHAHVRCGKLFFEEGERRGVVEAITRDIARLDPRGGPGFVEVDTSALFPEDFCQALHRKILADMANAEIGLAVMGQGGANLYSVGIQAPGAVRLANVVVLDADVADFMRLFNGAIIEGLNQNTWGERVKNESLSLRYGTPAKPLLIGIKPHPDPSYYSILTTLFGSETRRAENGKWGITTRAHTIIFNGTERTKRYKNQQPVMHYAPSEREDRLILVSRAVPEEPPL